MIFDSEVWKLVLWRELRDLRRYLAKTALSKRADAYDRAAVAMEKFVFTSAFMIRKLFDSRKISDQVSASNIRGISFARTANTRMTRLNWHHINRHYNLDSPRVSNISVRSMCDRLIHSAVFVCDFDPNRPTLAGFYFTSDWTKEKTLFYVKAQRYFSLVEKVIDDDIVDSRTNFVTGKTVLSNKPMR